MVFLGFMVHRAAPTILGLAACLFSLQSCGFRPPSRPSVLLIVVDTLRADRLGLYGWSESETSPVLDHFAQQSLIYDQAMAPAPFTMPSMAATFTGLYPDRTGVANHSTRDSLVNAPSATLAEVLLSAGYRTGGVVTNSWLRAERQGFNRGFEDAFIDTDGAANVTDRAIELLEDWGDDSFFLWAHYFEPHMPYAPRADDLRRLGVPSGSSSVVSDFVSGDFDRKQEIFFNGDYPDAKLEATRRLYEAEIRHADREIGRLLEALDTMGRADDTIVVLMSDHGESLGDHGLFFTHDFTLYEELVHVALVVRRPGGESARITTPVSLIDVMPSLCAWLTVECPDGVDGVPLPERDSAVDERALFAASAPWRERYGGYPRHYVRGLEGRWTMIRRGSKKVIKIPHPDGPIWEGYDLVRDPSELEDVFEAEPDRAFGGLQEELLKWEARMRVSRPETREALEGLDGKTLEELRSLGYVR